MAARVTPGRARYEDILALPKNHVGEILFGVLHAHPRPALPHAEVASAIGAEVRGPFHRGRGGPGGWIILDEPELHLGPDPDIVVPDLAGWVRSRMPFVPSEPFTALAPDWICEVLSASTEAEDRGEKMTIYARERVRHAWLVDPLIRTLEVFRLDGDTWRMLKTWHDTVLVRAEPFEAMDLDLGLLWESLSPSDSEER
jgi:Uma2 family endonuclease